MPEPPDPPAVTDLLRALAAQLDLAGEDAAIVIVGGAALLVHGWISRATRDVDVIATGTPASGPHPATVAPPDPLPPGLVVAARKVARDFGIEESWLNTVVAHQWKAGLPPGFAGRVVWRRIGRLALGLAGRLDLIHLKMFAAVDHGPRSRHYRDLLALRPTSDELATAAGWVRTQDASPAFGANLDELIADALRHVE